MLKFLKFFCLVQLIHAVDLPGTINSDGKFCDESGKCYEVQRIDPKAAARKITPQPSRYSRLKNLTNKPRNSISSSKKFTFSPNPDINHHLQDQIHTKPPNFQLASSSSTNLKSAQSSSKKRYKNINILSEKYSTKNIKKIRNKIKKYSPANWYNNPGFNSKFYGKSPEELEKYRQEKRDSARVENLKFWDFFKIGPNDSFYRTQSF